jgi:hypothetical protein
LWVSQWHAWNDRPWDVPSNPNLTYADEGWVDWYDWLGLKRRTFLPFMEAREVARAKNFSSLLEVRHPFDSSLSKAVVK